MSEEKKEKPAEDWETAYMAGHEDGYQMAIKEVIKKLGRMRWYGGDKQAQRAD